MSLDDEMQEQPRPEPGFRVYVERESTKIDVTHAVMDVYDIAINSMDFGSGFLSTEEVGYLRKLGSGGACQVTIPEAQRDAGALQPLDWTGYACQSLSGCTRRATHIAHVHAVDECDDFGPFGNIVALLCGECLNVVKADLHRQLSRLLGMAPTFVHCLTCGAPVVEVSDVLREVVAL